jgi:hypothetical protein
VPQISISIRTIKERSGLFRAHILRDDKILWSGTPCDKLDLAERQARHALKAVLPDLQVPD